MGEEVRSLASPAPSCFGNYEQGLLAGAFLPLSLVFFPACIYPESRDIQDALSPCIAVGLCVVLILDTQRPQSLSWVQGRAGAQLVLWCTMVVSILPWGCKGCDCHLCWLWERGCLC